MLFGISILKVTVASNVSPDPLAIAGDCVKEPERRNSNFPLHPSRLFQKGSEQNHGKTLPAGEEIVPLEYLQQRLLKYEISHCQRKRSSQFGKEQASIAKLRSPKGDLCRH